MEQLLAMGFAEHTCRKALQERPNVDAACNYIFNNADKPDSWWLEGLKDEPAEASGAPSGAPGRSEAPGRSLSAQSSNGVGAASVEAELPAVIGALGPVADAKTKALSDPAFLRRALGGLQQPDAENALQALVPDYTAESDATVAGVASVAGGDGAQLAPTVSLAIDPARAAALWETALTARWGEYVEQLGVKELLCVGVDARRLGGRRAVAQPADLREVCERLITLAVDGSVAGVQAALQSEPGKLLAQRGIALAEGGTGAHTAPSSPRKSASPRAADGATAATADAGATDAAPAKEGGCGTLCLSVPVDGTFSPLELPFSIAPFGSERTSLEALDIVAADLLAGKADASPAEGDAGGSPEPEPEPAASAAAQLANAAAVGGKVVLFRRGTTPFQQMVALAQEAAQAGAAAILIVNKKGEDKPLHMPHIPEATRLPIPVISVGAPAADTPGATALLLTAGESGTAKLALKFDANPHQLTVLNEHLSVVSYTGGSEKDPASGQPINEIANALELNLSSVHCSAAGVGHTLSLAFAATAVTVTHVVIHAAARCTEPLRRGRLRFETPPPPCEGDSCPLTPPPPTLSEERSFEVPKGVFECVVALSPPVVATTAGLGLRLVFDDTWGEGSNVDLAMVAVVGCVGTAEPTLLPATTAGVAVPASLGVTGLRRAVQRKQWMPLESDPTILTRYLHKIGVPTSYCFHDILSFEDWALEMVPTPALAVLLLFPVTAATEAKRKEEAATIATSGQPSLPPSDVALLHIEQKVGNACGTIGLVHAAANLVRSGEIDGVAPESWLGKFLAKCPDGLSAAEAGKLLEDDVEIEEAHAQAEGQSHDVQARREACHRHFTSLIMRGGALWELDGRKATPIHRGASSGGSFLRDAVALIKRRFVDLCPGEQFVAFALGPAAGAPGGGGHGGGGGEGADPAAVASLTSMGFTEAQATQALEATAGNVEMAAAMLLD